MLWFQNTSEFWIYWGLHKVLNKIFHDRCLAEFRICLRFWICHFLNILGLTSLWIKFSIVCISQGFEYASSSEYTSVTQDSVLNSLSYIFGRFLSIPCALNMPGLEYTRVVNMLRFCVNCILKILDILNVLSSEYAKV